MVSGLGKEMRTGEMLRICSTGITPSRDVTNRPAPCFPREPAGLYDFVSGSSTHQCNAKLDRATLIAFPSFHLDPDAAPPSWTFSTPRGRRCRGPNTPGGIGSSPVREREFGEMRMTCLKSLLSSFISQSWNPLPSIFTSIATG